MYNGNLVGWGLPTMSQRLYLRPLPRGGGLGWGYWRYVRFLTIPFTYTLSAQVYV